ncbi:MAG: flagellar biosynthetic protein FliP [Candidatus Raymondbacteria bacterium RifOxyA12_full_50_37]|uniref:Flagellar biosynthetic protein FliP n=1 Tax=Candidatus Raymondbacteria bacterium RIFOXYD12_FULL_49_13 TaxID=1817890 RepID=A0A1F7FB35_UNCRA|nr:MAG: flagellar biosynthetic protein FliP [Candidatus Raymondbacteria bacterium RifOxyA12_full_50_37]OGJ92607.1 MAG: flagellar biosynthetic protein FliP [Candidatus Raymondbacteria bacterium RIFOXYA2_FULL_49_16]OGJ97961.1 MAG: flagellar biosynthetic protein FliP [Candidatus Raymondbacteria bacterium RIFOXYC2_FULL_50_21]OGJ98616.1 MAG: flagellar biosynthetic protein FliP [Candidatus Raymondbacteria bacterium RifOxyC12_full_50_8]OGK01991.1 MAG: flagellar biosynthetic protein FliP [Candidatus Ra
MKNNKLRLAILAIAIVLMAASSGSAQILPKVTLGFDQAKTPQDAAVTLEILFLITILTLAPSILIMMTSFTRIVIVLSFLRKALGTTTEPPNQVIVGLSLFLTLFIMMPVLTQINDKALQPYLAEQIDYKVALKEAMSPLRLFMLKQVEEKDIALFVRISKMEIPRTVDDLPNTVIIPAFIISELKKAFIIGFLLYIPFLVIDMVVASLLMSMGMMMLPPILISLPFKLILFVLVDGWHLIVQQVVTSFA